MVLSRGSLILPYLNFLKVSDARDGMKSCTANDVLSFTVADQAAYSTCFSTGDWSWRLAFEECLTSELRLRPGCASQIGGLAYPLYFPVDTCQNGDCAVRYSMQKAISTIASQSLGHSFTPGACTIDDLNKIASIEISSAGFPSAGAANLTSNCTTCLAQESSCPSAQIGDVCYPDNNSAACYGCRQINAAKQTALCSVGPDTNPNTLDCSARDLEHLSRFSVNGAIECFANVLGWAAAGDYCLTSRAEISPPCAQYLTSQVFATDSDRECVYGVDTANELSTSSCLISMWARGTAEILSASASLATIVTSETCSSNDLEKFAQVSNNTALISLVANLSTTCQECVSTDPVATIQADCEQYCNTTSPDYVDQTWSCTGCLQFQSLKVIGNCTMGDTKSMDVFVTSYSTPILIALVAVLFY